MRINIDGVWITYKRALVIQLSPADKANICNMTTDAEYYGHLHDEMFNNSVPEMRAYMEEVKGTDLAIRPE